MWMMEINLSGSRLDKLKRLAEILAEAIDEVEYKKDLPPLVRQYREVIKEIDEIEGGALDTDDITEIIKEREVEGKSGAIR